MIPLSDLAGAAVALLLGLLFGLGVRRVGSSNRPPAGHMRARTAVFTAGILTFVVAWLLPGGSVVPAMTAHVLLAFAVPPLLLLGIPRPVLLPLFAHRRSRRLLQALTQPFRAGALFLLVLCLCYLPIVFNAALRNDGWRFGVELAVLSAAVLFWWPVIEPLPAWDRELADVGKLLYLFVGSATLKTLGFILATTPRPIYTLPSQSRPLWGLSASNDQQYAGWLMVAAGTFVLLAAATVICAHLLHEPNEAHVSLQPGDQRMAEE